MTKNLPSTSGFNVARFQSFKVGKPLTTAAIKAVQLCNLGNSETLLLTNFDPRRTTRAGHMLFTAWLKPCPPAFLYGSSQAAPFHEISTPVLPGRATLATD